MLYYIIGEEVESEMMDSVEVWNDSWNNIATEEINNAILAQIETKD